MEFGSVLQMHSKKTIRALPLRKSSLHLFITLVLILFLSLSALGNTDVRNRDGTTIQQTDPLDTDRDGLSDDLETMTLKTDANNRTGDKDGDGLYDFEEYLGTYGIGGTDNPTYHYNDSTSVVDGVLDIYHLFGLSSNKSMYLRDQSFSDKNDGFTDSLLWNVNFSGQTAGGSINTDNVVYSYNIMTNVTFSGSAAGGSLGVSATVSYYNNTMTNVSFTGENSGGSPSAPVSYYNNTMTNVSFTGIDAGGSETNALSYSNNTMTNVSFTGSDAGGSSQNGAVSYKDNTISDIFLNGTNVGRSKTGVSTYEDNDIVNDRYDTDSDGLGDGRELFENGTDPTKSDTDGDTLGDYWEVTYSGVDGVDPLMIVADDVLISDLDLDGLTVMEEAAANTNPQSPDTDSDTLGDKWEATYNGSFGANPLMPAKMEELGFDNDSDGLTLMEEEAANTNSSSNDTDGDGLGDKWEVTYNGSFGVNPLVPANDSVLASDNDSDGLTLLQEATANTNSTVNDTDGDGLGDRWEVTYNGLPGVNPLENVTDIELASDLDNDTLNLSREEKANTNPSLKDTDSDGLNDSYELILMTNPALADSDNDGLNDKWEVTYNGLPGVNPLMAATEGELLSDMDGDGLNLLGEAEANTDPNSGDTDGDGVDDKDEVLTKPAASLTDADNDSLNDKWEFENMNAPGVNVTEKATPEELASDLDGDGLNLLEEAMANTDPTSEDTDGDGLNDGYEVLTLMTNATLNDTDGDYLDDKWEVDYALISGVNPLIAITASLLASDDDNDSLSLIEESRVNTHPLLSDTDGDGLGDGWEVRYSSVSGVNPLVNATADELASDTDGDGLTLLDEFKANTNPEVADNPILTNTITSTITPAVSPSGTSEAEGSFNTLLVISVLGAFFAGIILYIIIRFIISLVRGSDKRRSPGRRKQ